MGLQRFKEMREMHGSSSRDDRNKREQQREEREMAKFAQMYLSFFLLHPSFFQKDLDSHCAVSLYISISCGFVDMFFHVKIVQMPGRSSSSCWSNKKEQPRLLFLLNLEMLHQLQIRISGKH